MHRGRRSLLCIFFYLCVCCGDPDPGEGGRPPQACARSGRRLSHTHAENMRDKIFRDKNTRTEKFWRIRLTSAMDATDTVVTELGTTVSRLTGNHKSCY